MRSIFLSAFFLVSVAAPLTAVVACSSPESSEDGKSSEDEIRTALGEEGSACSPVRKCKPTLVCKTRSTAPPPGAVGLPLPAPTTSGPPSGAVGLPLPPPSPTTGGPPSGAVGLPIPPPPNTTCQKPAEGEEGSECVGDSDCDPGLQCTHGGSSSSSGGPPNGAVGLPLPAPTATTGGPPSGAVGLPLPPPKGTCSLTSGSSSGGPPNGVVGLPLPPPKD